MKKIKFLIASMIGAIALVFACVLGTKVKAETVNDVYKADLTTITENNKTVTATVVGRTNTMSFTATTHKTGASVTGTSLITNSSKEFTAGAKMAASDTITFTTTHNWSASILFAVKETSSKVKGLSTNNGTITNPTVSAASTLYTATISSGTAGNVTISRDGNKETWIFEIVVTETYDDSVSYKTVTFLDSDKTTSLGSRTTTAGGTVTAIDVVAPMGKVFDKWLKVSDDKAFDFSTAINDDLSLYASYVTDPNYVVGDGYTLDSALMGALYKEGYTASFDAESTRLTDTNICVLYGSMIKETDATPKTYYLNTNGSGNNTKRGISITTDGAGTITFIADGNGSDRTCDISKIVNKSNTVQQSYTLNKNDSSTEYTFTVEAAGTYYLYGSGTINIYSIEFTPYISNSATTTVDVESSGTEVRFITTVSGVELANIKSLELVLWKNSVSDENKNTNNLQMTTVYTSVINATKTYDGGTNTYYGIVKISGTDKLKARSITKLCFNVIVTFQDNSTKSMDNNLEFTL